MQSQDHSPDGDRSTDSRTPTQDRAVVATPTEAQANISRDSRALSHRNPPPLPSRSTARDVRLGPEVCTVDPANDPSVSIEEALSADDAAMAPVERNTAQAVAPRARGAWLGWAAASALLVASGSHYLWAYRPLEAQREQADAARVQRLQAHEAQLSTMRDELERTRAELEQAKVEAAAREASAVEAAAAPEPTATVETPRAPASVKAARRSAARTRQSARDVTSAKPGTAASSRKPAAQARKAADKSQPLRGVLSPSNDPLEGL